MSSVELRKKVIKKLESANDLLLEEILGIIELDNAKSEMLSIPKEHMQAIAIGLAEIDAGETVTNEEVNNRVRKWLDK